MLAASGACGRKAVQIVSVFWQIASRCNVFRFNSSLKGCQSELEEPTCLSRLARFFAISRRLTLGYRSHRVTALGSL
jgi:hypothetical protein